jgi:hypothetical protein
MDKVTAGTADPMDVMKNIGSLSSKDYSRLFDAAKYIKEQGSKPNPEMKTAIDYASAYFKTALSGTGSFSSEQAKANFQQASMDAAANLRAQGKTEDEINNTLFNPANRDKPTSMLHDLDKYDYVPSVAKGDKKPVVTQVATPGSVVTQQQMKDFTQGKTPSTAYTPEQAAAAKNNAMGQLSPSAQAWLKSRQQKAQ